MGHRILRASGSKWAVLIAAWVIWLSPPTAQCSLIGPSVHGLAVSGSQVAVKVGSKILLFDHDGAFRGEVVVTDLPVERARLLALTDDGRLWFALPEEDDKGNVKATAVKAVDETGSLVVSHRITGDWSVYISPRGRVFAGRVEAKRLRVECLHATSGQLTAHAEVAVEKNLRVLDLDVASAVSWAVNDDGDMFVLTTAAERGRVTRYGQNGQPVKVWDVLPDPVTSVSYMRDVFLGGDGVPYVTHSSWEVSSSVGNDGSVLRLDMTGGEPFRIKEGIGYLQHVGVSPSGDVFVTDLSEEVYRFSPAGERVLSWVAVPPHFGESWDERRQRVEAARRTGPSATTAELVNAVVYGNFDISEKATRWLQAKGPSAVPDITAALLRFGKAFPLVSAAERVWKAHPRETAQFFEQTRDEGIRRALATFLAYTEAPPPGVREVLSRMVLAGDDRARHALNELGPTPEVVQANIAAFRRGQRGGDRAFDATWHLSHSYPWSIGALETALLDSADADRVAVRSLMLEASRELGREPWARQKAPRLVPSNVVARTRAWVADPDPFVRQTGAIALTSLGVTGYEAEAVAAARTDPALVVPTLEAFAVLAETQPGALNPHVESLSRLARSYQSPRDGDDALADLARITHPAIVRQSLLFLADDSLLPKRRDGILCGLKPDMVPRPDLMALLHDRGWQKALAGSYAYHAFLRRVLTLHPDDREIRAEVKDALVGLLTDTGPDGGGGDARETSRAHRMAMVSLRPLVVASDIPRLAVLLDDPRFNGDARMQVLWLLSRIAPDDLLRERMLPLLNDPDLGLIAAQSLGRVGYRPALDVLMEQGLKRLGAYSNVDLDVDSFRPFGEDAEQALLSLLDYPNTGTRELVRLFLVQWPSPDGLRRIRAELDDAIQSGRAPESYTLAALAYASENVVEPLLKLAAEHPEAMESLSPERGNGPLGQQLRRAASTETDSSRIQLLQELIRRLSPDEEAQ